MKKKFKLTQICLAALLLLFFAPIPDYIALKIGLNETYMGRSVGYGAYTPIQYYRYKMLDMSASTPKLKSLYRKHKSPAVKCYSYRALLNRTGIDHFELLKEGMLDERKVVTQSGCIVMGAKVGDILIEQTYPSSNDSMLIDSILLYSKVKLKSKSDLLMRMKPKLKDYNRIRELASDRNFPEAIVALSKYQLLKDTTIIKWANKDSVNLYYFLIAVKNFPIESFKDDIVEIQQKNLQDSLDLSYTETRSLYKALVRYNTPEIGAKLQHVVNTYDTLRSVNHGLHLDSIKISKYKDYIFKAELAKDYWELNDFLQRYKWIIEKHCENIFLALTHFKNPYYEDVLSKIKIEDWRKEEIIESAEWRKEFE